MSPRTWFITGISSGLGRYRTEQQLERGPVAGTFRKLEAVADLKRQYGATRERIERGAYLPPGAALEAQKDLAFSTDFAAPSAA